MIPRNHEIVAPEVHIFEEGVESADCRNVLCNCLKNLAQNMNDLYMLANSNKEMRIKGDKQFVDLTSSVESLTTKFDELQKEKKGKDELINRLRIEVSSFKVEVKNLEKKQMISSNNLVEIARRFMD